MPKVGFWLFGFQQSRYLPFT